MKRVFLLILIIATTSFIANASIKESKAKKFVIQFLKEMIAHKDNDGLKKYISPAYLKENNLDISKYNINTYYPVDFSIVGFDKEPCIVYAKIWGKDRGWVHKLGFKVVMEDKKLYLYPGQHSDDYIHPWYTVESYITE
jgi:hypothetical protein